MKTLMAFGMMALTAWAGDDRAEVVRRLETQKISVDFEDVKLPEAIDYLRDVTGLNLILLPKAMEREGDTKIRLKVKELTVKSVLRLLLSPRGLTTAFREGALVVLPKEELQDSTVLKMFDVRALQVKKQDFPGPQVELTGSSSKKSGPSLVLTLLLEPVPSISDDFLVDMVRENTGGGSWNSNPKAALNLSNGMLMVNQTPSVLREIETLLGLLGQYQ